MKKAVRYIIKPQSAKPAQVRRDWSGDLYDYNIDQVESQALREVLQTTIRSNPFSGLIRGFLASYTDELTWLAEGPGIGREMRRTFSGLFGRFFARAYLNDCHGFVWFCPLDGRNQYVGERLRVYPGVPRQDLPDWICAGSGHLALAEAKGARPGSHLSRLSHPGPITSALGQLENCRVSVFDRRQNRWIERRIKGWAVLNQWKFQRSPVPPYLFVVDPVTEGEPLPSDHIPALTRAIAREHVAGIFRGLGLFRLALSLGASGPDAFAESLLGLVEFAAEPVTVVVPALEIRALGRVFRSTPVDVSSDYFGDEFFLGVAHQVIQDLQSESEEEPAVLATRSLPSEGVFIGHDGFVIARRSTFQILEGEHSHA
jgi:hypothetical protein